MLAMDVLLDFDTSGFDFTNLDNMVEITEAQQANAVHAGEKKKRDKLAARACVLCNQAHTACDNGVWEWVGWNTIHTFKHNSSHTIIKLAHAADVYQKGLLIFVVTLNLAKEDDLQRYANLQAYESSMLTVVQLPEQYDLDLARQAQKRQQADNAAFNFLSQPLQQQIPMAVPAPSNIHFILFFLLFKVIIIARIFIWHLIHIMMFSPPPYEGMSVQGFDLDSALFTEAQNPMDAQDFDMSSIITPGPMPQMLPPPMSVLSSPEYMPQQTPSPNTSAPATPQSPQSPPPSQSSDNVSSFSSSSEMLSMQVTACAPPELKYRYLTDNSSFHVFDLYRFAESQMEKVFTRLAVRAGYTAMTPEIRGIMTKMVQFYSPLIQQYGNHLLGILFFFFCSASHPFALRWLTFIKICAQWDC
jgi:hypothetical protein